MLRLAWCSPFPPERSGIADYSVELVEAISEFADVTLFVNDPAVFDVPSLNHLKRYPIESVGERRFEFDFPIYQIGNHILHQKIYDQAIKVPGIVVLHEFWLNGFMTQKTVGQQRSAAYFREVVYESFPADFNKNFDHIYPGINQIQDHLCFNQRLVDGALGVMVHSQFVADLIAANNVTPSDLKINPKTNIKVIRQLGRPQAQIAPWPASTFKTIFACAGQITPEKQIDKVLDALQQLVARGVQAELRLIGEAVAGVPVQQWINERQLNEVVIQTGYIESIEVFEQHLSQAHVLINLRQPTVGETSAVVIRSMGAGRPVIVYDHGWYGELPDCCIKIQPGSADALASAMQMAAADHDQLKTLGEACHAEIQAHHHPQVVAHEMIEWLENIVEQLLAASN
ncbi:MAG: glycosyltransferase involved in cell wall biosynthesis [Cellvibrionaceae bacterium]